MRRYYPVLLTISLLALPAHDAAAGLFRNRHRCCCEAPVVQSPSEAIRQVLDNQVAAWNRGDLDGFMAGYWHSPDLTFMSGSTVTRGWQATLDRYHARYQGEGKEMGKLTFSDLEIQVLDADNALVRGRWNLEKSKETVGGLYTLIFKRFPEGWRIVHDHTSG